MTDTLVPIDKRVIHDQREAQSGRALGNGGIQRHAIKRHLRLCDCRFHTTKIPYSVRSACLFHDATVQIQYLSERQVSHQRSRR
jgi:hypothetical protein